MLNEDAPADELGTNFNSIAPSNAGRAYFVAAFLTGIASLNQPADAVPAEMMRLSVSVPPTPRDSQSTFGVAGGDLAGFPN